MICHLQVLIPFYATTLVALGSLALLASAMFRDREAAVVLAMVGLMQAGQAVARLALEEDLYLEGRAWAASKFQGFIALGDLVIVMVVIIVGVRHGEKRD